MRPTIKQFTLLGLVLALLGLGQFTGLSAASWNGPAREAGLTQTTTPLTGIVQVSASFHTCALTLEGDLLCWGANSSRQLGDGTFNHRLLPMRVERLEPKARAVATSNGETCVVTTEGAVLCWGSNLDGQLGNGTTQGSSWPVMVSGLDRGVTAVSGNYGHFCALTLEGDVWCWGRNDYGQLGDGTTEQRLTPVKVSGLNRDIATLAVGNYHTCVLTNTGGVKCWGQNFAGHLGDGTRENRAEPVAVVGLDQGVSAITLGLNHTCALTDVGAVLCWGGNISG
ncbi:MAG: RCC1 repeat-containing protein, partial [Chloroflexia bacterium]|nr:RCC1 repeat-containing protein [Chloroflexia bacterium]